MKQRYSYPNAQTIHRRVMDNGATVLVYENFDSATVVVDGLIRAGAITEPPEKAGLSGLTAGLLMRGTRSRTFEEIYEQLETSGAGLSFAGVRHTTRFAGHGLAEDMGLVIDLMREALREPTFPQDQVELIRGQSITGLRMRKNHTGSMARLAFLEMAYDQHPYGVPISGYEETVAAITRQDLLDFHRSSYGPDGMILAVAGAVRAEDVFAALDGAFGDWRNPSQQPLPPPPEAPRPRELRRHTIVMADKTQCDIVMGLPGPARSAPDYLDAALMNTILGVFGSMGRIGRNVREKQGLAYYAASHLESGFGPGPWSASAGVAPENVERAIASIQEEIRLIREELVPDDELADSKAYRIGALPMGLETNGGIADAISDLELMGYGLDYLQELPDRIEAITPERIRAAAQKYLSPDQMVIVVAGPVAAAAGEA